MFKKKVGKKGVTEIKSNNQNKGSLSFFIVKGVKYGVSNNEEGIIMYFFIFLVG